jgi:hypothetical protein
MGCSGSSIASGASKPKMKPQRQLNIKKIDESKITHSANDLITFARQGNLSMVDGIMRKHKITDASDIRGAHNEDVYFFEKGEEKLDTS